MTMSSCRGMPLRTVFVILGIFSCVSAGELVDRVGNIWVDRPGMEFPFLDGSIDGEGI